MIMGFGNLKICRGVGKLEPQESWWFSSCPKASRLGTKGEPVFQFEGQQAGRSLSN